MISMEKKTNKEQIPANLLWKKLTKVIITKKYKSIWDNKNHRQINNI